MNSFLEPAALLKMNFFWGIFQGFFKKVSEDFVYGTRPCIFVAIVDKLRTVFLRCCISSNKRPQRLLSFETVRCSGY